MSKDSIEIASLKLYLRNRIIAIMNEYHSDNLSDVDPFVVLQETFKRINEEVQDVANKVMEELYQEIDK